jgi:hypothetical protein
VAKHWLAVFLPGMFLLGLNIGSGRVMAMTTAWADDGMPLLWTADRQSDGEDLSAIEREVRFL